MLTDADVAFILANREEITEHRLESVTLYKETVTGTNPYTKEPIVSTITQPVQAVVGGQNGHFKGEDGGTRDLVNGVSFRNGDLAMVFSVDVDLSGVKKIVYNDVPYILYSSYPAGLGATNRFVCVVRRVN